MYAFKRARFFTEYLTPNRVDSDTKSSGIYEILRYLHPNFTSYCVDLLIGLTGTHDIITNGMNDIQSVNKIEGPSNIESEF